MWVTDEILIKHHMTPTLFGGSQIRRFSQFLTDARDGTLEEFIAFAEKIARELTNLARQLTKAAESMEDTVASAIRHIDGLLGDDPQSAVLFSDALTSRALTEKHVALLHTLEGLLNRLPDAFQMLQDCRRQAEYTLLSSDVTEETILRRIALAECRPDAPICSYYQTIAESSPTEDLIALLGASEEIAAVLFEGLSDFIAESSRVITDVNKEKLPQASYFNLLRGEQINLHDRKTTINKIKNEVQNVKASDVL